MPPDKLCAFACTALHSCYALRMMSYKLIQFMAAGLALSTKFGSHQPVRCAGVLSVPMGGIGILCTILHHAMHASTLPAFHPEMHQAQVQVHFPYLGCADAALTSTSKEMGAGKWNGMHLVGRYLVTSFAPPGRHFAPAQWMPCEPGIKTQDLQKRLTDC